MPRSDGSYGPNPLVASLGLDMHWGRIKTDRFMRVAGHDGYVGYRSEPATASAFHDYLGRIFSR